MDTVLLPCDVSSVLGFENGSKGYEYRKRPFAKDKHVDKVIIYANSPVSMVVGEIHVKRIIKDTAANLWNKTSEFSGMREDRYKGYMSSVPLEDFGMVAMFLENPPDIIFNKDYTKKDANNQIEKAVFQYYREIAMAIEIGGYVKYKHPLELRTFGMSKPPQSYVYI